MKNTLLIAIAVSAVLAQTHTSTAQTFWTDATGNWFVAGNWSAGVPDAATAAEIDNAGTAQIGAAGAAALNLRLGGAAVANSGTLDIGAAGVLTLTSFANIGDTGTGILNITNGGKVNGTTATIGSLSGSNGTVNVGGAGSAWTNSLAITIGSNGTGALNISAGGVVSNNTAAFIGSGTGTGAVDVGGAGSKWTITGNLFVGTTSTGNTLDVHNGGVVSDVKGFIGGNAGSEGTATIDGAGSMWTNSSDLTVGSNGTGTLNIQNGGTVSNTEATVGTNTGSEGTVTVSGTGSTWTNSSFLDVGAQGTGHLSITNGGVVNSDSSIVGTSEDGSGDVTVNGMGSKWTITGGVAVGYFGNGTLNIQNGGAVSDTSGQIGAKPTGVGVVTVDGAGSTWTNSTELFVGIVGNGTLNIQNGGAVTDTDAEIGEMVGSTGAVTVTGMGSTWTNSGSLYVGDLGDATMDILNGGAVSNTFAIVGAVSTSTATVDGAGSTWTNSGDLLVGQYRNGVLNIRNGGVVSNAAGEIAQKIGGFGTVTVDGTGSAWMNSGGLKVGSGGTGALHIMNGGVVTNSFGQLGSSDGSSGTATVDGMGSTWTNNGTFVVGSAGTGNLTITNGGHVTSGISIIGGSPTGDGTVIVEDFGSIWDPSSLYVGGDPMGPQGTGLLRLQNNGRVDAPTTVWSTGTLEYGPSSIINGTLTFDGGTLRAIANASFAHDVTLDAGGVVIDSNGFSGQLTGAFTGTGGITKINPGRIEFTNISNYGGNTEIDDGEFIVIGEITTPQTNVNPGGLLGGTGILHSNVFNSGVVSPGFSPGTFTIDGNYTQNSDGTLRIEIGGLGMNEHDLLLMTNGGTASLDGTLEVLRFNGFVPHHGDSFTILLATGGVSGEFSALTSDFPGVLQPEVIYNPTFVDIVFTLGSFNIGGLTPNQQSVADELDAVANDPRAMDLIDFLGVEPLGLLPHDYDLIAPEELASIYEIGFSQATIQGLNLERRMDDIRGGSTGFSANGYQMRDSYGLIAARPDGSVEETSSPRYMQPSANNRWGVFVTGTGQFVHVGDDDSNARGYDITTGGVTAGVDYRITPNIAVGLFGTYAHSNVDLTESGHIDADGGKGGLFATFFTGEFYFDLAASGGWNNYDTRRTALLGDARGSTDGTEFSGLVAGGYDWTLGCITFGPTGSFQYTYVDFNSFTEDGSLAPLHFPDQDESAERSTVGLRALCNWKAGRAIFRPEVRAAWKHEFGNRSYPIDSQFASGAGNIFSVWGPDTGRDSVLVSGGIGIQWSSRVSTYVYYDGDLGRSNYNSHNISGGISFDF